MRSSACARRSIPQNKAETRHRPMGNPIGRFFRFVIAPLRMQQGSLTCHCEPCAARRGNLAVPGWIMGKLSAKSQLPSRDSHVASLLGMTSRRCVSFEQWPVLIGSACRALSVTFGQLSQRESQGRFAPRNDKLGSLAPQNVCRKDCQTAWRSGSAATDTIGTHHFNGGLYELQMPSRDCHVGLRPPRNDNSGGHTIFTMACTGRECGAGPGAMITPSGPPA